MFRELPPKGPDGSRAITTDMRVDARHAGRFLRLFGGIWTGVCLPLGMMLVVVFGRAGPAAPPLGAVLASLAAGLSGLVCYALGRWRQSRALDLFRNGEEVCGEVVSVEQDFMQRINKRHPWKVRYRFGIAGAAQAGSMTYWTDQPPPLEAGREVVILFAQGNPDRSLLWAAATPQVVPLAEGTARARFGDGGWRSGPYAESARHAAAPAQAEAVADDIEHPSVSSAKAQERR